MTMTGRPSTFDPTTGDIICERLADGESLRSICSSEEMPSKSTVFRWLETNETFRDQYTRARETQADTLFDEILEIADDGRNDKYATEDGTETVNHDHIQRSKLRVDARKWMAGKLQPKKYGEKVTNELTGRDGKDLIPEASPTDMAKALLSVLNQARSGG